METVKDFFQSIYDSYTERIKSPLIGSFLLSFFFFNWRFFAILFYSDWPMHCRIEWIEEQYYNLSNFLCPLGIALFYILAIPHINLFFEYCLSYYSKEKYEKKKKSRKADLEREKDEASIVREIADAKAGTSKILELQERNEALKRENSALTNQNQEDLERHNKALEQSINRENTYKQQIRQYSVLVGMLEHFDPSTVSMDEITLPNIKEIISIADNFNDDSKKKYELFISTYLTEKRILNIEEVYKYETVGLIAVQLKNKSLIRDITPKGYLLYDYLKKGFDLY
jgi:hypothetical protein